MKFKFNRRLVPICSIYFLLSLGSGFAGPYMSLLMRNLGLTLADVSFVNGLFPVFGFFLTPLLGYVGDKLGLKLVLIMTVFGLMLSTTSLNFLPVYRQYSAKIGLDNMLYNDTLESFDSDSIV